MVWQRWPYIATHLIATSFESPSFGLDSQMTLLRRGALCPSGLVIVLIILSACHGHSLALVDLETSWPCLRGAPSASGAREAIPCSAMGSAMGAASPGCALQWRTAYRGVGGRLPVGPLRGGEGDEDSGMSPFGDSDSKEHRLPLDLDAPSSPLPPRWEADHGDSAGAGSGSGGGGGEGEGPPAAGGGDDPGSGGDGVLAQDLLRRGFTLGVALLLGSVAGYLMTRVWPGHLFLPDDDDDAAFDAWRKQRYSSIFFRTTRP